MRQNASARLTKPGRDYSERIGSRSFPEKRRLLPIYTMLNEIDGISCIEPKGAFYAFPSVKGLIGREFRGSRPASSAELAELAIEEAKVAVVPGEAFGAPGYFRMSYALGDENLVEGVTRLAKLFGEAS